MSSGERPIGAAKGKQSDTEALCQPPPPPVAQARACPSTQWALNRCFQDFSGPLFLWSRMQDWAFVTHFVEGRRGSFIHVCDCAFCS